jgi:hypothetical protein
VSAEPAAPRRAPARRKAPARKPAGRKLLADYVTDARSAWAPGIEITPAWVRTVTDCARGTSKNVADTLRAETDTAPTAIATAPLAVPTADEFEREAA